MRLREEVSIFEGMVGMGTTPSTMHTAVATGAATNTTRIGLGNYRKALWHFEITDAASPTAWVGNQSILLHAMNALTAAATPATIKSVEVAGGQNMLAADILYTGATADDTVTINGVTFTNTAGGWGASTPLEFNTATELASAINTRFNNIAATNDATVVSITVSDVGNTTINAELNIVSATPVVRTRWACADIEVDAEELNQNWPFVFARLQNGGVAASPASGLFTYCVALKSGSVYKPGHNVAAARG